MEVSGRKDGDMVLEDHIIQKSCIPCKEDKTDTLADGLCIECKQDMCKTCFRHHRKGRFCKDHTLVDFNQTYDTIIETGSEGLEKCQEHKDETSKFYCSTHEVVGCGDCIVQKHRFCQIHYISEKADGFQNSEEFEDFDKGVKYCTREITSCQFLANHNRKESEALFSKCRTDIETFRLEINAWLDEQEANILQKVEEVEVQSDTNIADVETKCEELTNEVFPVDEANKTLANQSNKLFISVLKNKPTLNRIKEDIESLKTRNTSRKHAFKRNPKIEDLISRCIELGTLGCIASSEHHVSELGPESKPQAAPAAQRLPAKTTVDDKVDKEAARYKEGDKVRIEIDVDVLKMTEDNRGAWNDHMTECIGKTGVVIVSKGNDITVDFESVGRWTFHESVLNKVREFVPGEVVKVNDRADHVRMLQTDRGGWNELMVKVIGRNGTVEEIDEDGDVQVSFGDYTWTFNPECLGPADGKADWIIDDDSGLKHPVEQRKEPETEEEKMEDLFEMIITGETEKVNRIIQKEPQLMLMDLQGKFAVHLACKNGQIDILKAMFKCASKEALIEMCDTADGITPLLAAVIGEQIDMVKFLVAEGANKKAVNHNKQGAVQMAVASKDVAMLKVLRDHGFDVNQKDLLKQFPLVDAIDQGNEDIIDIILEWPDLDIQYTDSSGFSPFLLACREGNLKAVQKILQKRLMGIRECTEHDGYSGVHLAAFNGNKDVVEFLIRQPLVEIDGLTSEERTPLHLACAEGSFEVMTILVDGGANITLCDASGKNCLHIYLEGTGAKEIEQVDDFTRIVEYLIDHRVSVDGLDEAGKRPAEYVTVRMKETYQSIVEKRAGQENIDKQNEPSSKQGPPSLPKTGSAIQELGSPRIEDMGNLPVGAGQGLQKDQTTEEQGQAKGDGNEKEESPRNM